MGVGQSVFECSAQDAWNAVHASEDAFIIDVRTNVEWTQVGAPDLGDIAQKLHFISWQLPPDMRVNENFLGSLEEAGIPKDGKLYFLCRSGVRSLAAAKLASEAGYQTTVNIIAGFEGIAGPDGQRTGGWLGAGLPATRVRTKS
jgi:rhodanese-related sulfurtransferase